ncbi:MAG: PAS domain-containing protein [Propionibacteriaceae bacterium]|jgi:aerotaxis receptor|nr:PAS domain-containing protein [Propionibacteriaceae bacterium]
MLDGSVTWPTMERTREATGAHHEVGQGQLFFSMTDRRGIITAANSVFVDLARFARDELMGQPHSIIRHPAMPSGCFKLMWDEILDGRPFCCYIHNLAKDGSTYTVFATITPAANDMFLSVRVRPLRRDLLDEALDWYAATRPVELAAREHGINRRGAAAVGSDKLAELVTESGYPSYDDFQWTALVAEAEARSAVPAGLETRPGATGPLATMLICCHTLAAELRRWSGHQADIAHMARSLTEGIPHLLGAAASATQTATSLRSACRPGQEGTREVQFLVSRLAQMSRIIDELVAHLREFRRSCQDTRAYVALAEIHTDALSQFVVEILDDGPNDYDRDAVDQVCQALDVDFTEVSERSEENASYAATMAHELDRAHALIADRQTTVAKLAESLPPATATLVPQITEELATVERALGLIEHLGHEAAALAIPQDTHLAEFQIAHLLELMDGLAG